MSTVLNSATITEKLGFPNLLDADESMALEYIHNIQQGIPVKTLEHFIDIDVLTRDDTYQLLGSTRTISRRYKTGRFNQEESDKLFRLIRTVVIAVDVFGTTQKANQWFHTPLVALEEKAPFEFLSTEAGTRLVETTLERIAYGTFS